MADKGPNVNQFKAKQGARFHRKLAHSMTVAIARRRRERRRMGQPGQWSAGPSAPAWRRPSSPWQ